MLTDFQTSHQDYSPLAKCPQRPIRRVHFTFAPNRHNADLYSVKAFITDKKSYRLMNLRVSASSQAPSPHIQMYTQCPQAANSHSAPAVRPRNISPMTVFMAITRSESAHRLQQGPALSGIVQRGQQNNHLNPTCSRPVSRFPPDFGATRVVAIIQCRCLHGLAAGPTSQTPKPRSAFLSLK